MRPRTIVAALVIVAACSGSPSVVPPASPDATASDPLHDPREVRLASLLRLTAGGENAEAYWSFAGDRLIFQTTRPGIACDQIMVMDAARPSEPRLVSTGQGRTTCAYFFPGDREVLYASTHAIDAACPPPPDRSQGYVWALYDYDLYRAPAGGGAPTKLFGVAGSYDAEATVCARDGAVIFTSDKDGDLELYRMSREGKDVVRLTEAPGYDGGAFFSPDCSKIVWRASRPTGEALADYQRLLKQHLVRPTKLEIWVANADGSDARQVTYLDAASFAPYWHPSGRRLLFSSNYGDAKGREFDIWAIDVDGTDLERITFAPGFDGFPMFSPDGRRLAFSSNRGAPPPPPGSHGGSDTDVFVAEWNDHASGPAPATTAADRIGRAIDWLAADAREGRGIGTRGLSEATAWVEAELRAAGVEGGLPGGGFRQPFEVTVTLARGAATRLAVDGAAVAAEAFVPSHVSSSASVSAKTVAVGWGIVDRAAKLDEYRGRDVRGKVAVVRRFVPAKLEARERELGDLSYKARLARERGAVGMIVVDVPAAGRPEQPLPTLRPRDGADVGIPLVIVTHAAAGKLATGSHAVELAVALEPVRRSTDNVVGVIRGAGAGKQVGAIVIGAHLDHLGTGGEGSLEGAGAIHNGADDNASGVATLIEIARTLAARRGQLDRDVYLVAFSAEEMGLLGAHHFVAHAPYAGPATAMINLDMVGRMRDGTVEVLGAESAPEWSGLVEPRCVAAGIRCRLSGSGYGPSDHMAFTLGGSPVVHFFTGAHLDYHRASDDPATIHAAGAARIAQVVAEVATALAAGPAPTYQRLAPPPAASADVPLRGASLGTIPSYGDDGKIPGVLLSDVVPGGAAEAAGLRGGDRIVEVGGTEVRNVQDLMHVLGKGVPGRETRVVYLRDGKRQTARATFGKPRARR